MKKMLCWACLLMALALLPALAMAEEVATMPEVAASIDWTALVVAVIGVIGTAVSALLGRVWVNYVRPWLEKRDLTDAAEIVVDAVEALLGRSCGEDKWKLALEKMEARGFNIDNEVVLDALRAAWQQLDLEQLAAGEKEKPPES